MARRSSATGGDVIGSGITGTTDDLDDLDTPSTDGIETGSLAIKESERIKEKELWQRPTTQRMLPNDGSTILRFEIPYARIMPPKTENPNIKRFVVYDLSVRQDSSVIDPNPATIERRYTDFLKLYTNLKKAHPTAFNSIYFPKKVLMGNFSPDLIAERSAAFEVFLDHIVSKAVLRESPHFLHFLQDIELRKACQLLDERRNESAIPLLENCFRLLNKIFMDRSKPVLLILCRLVAACTTSPVPHPSADRWAELALRRYETLCDTDLLPLYIPLLQTCSHLWWQRGRDQKLITDRLTDMSKKGININNSPPLMKAIHLLDPQTETI
ncbi:sorting nexin-20 isoform X3 [Episyrphus balteatus]|nr:sorting nexin-20 isoform X3 [Episyrphus balteatus]XP_055857643.1 sorting nexin-20 isoform X3 [Episyrphus balteatus]